MASQNFLTFSIMKDICGTTLQPLRIVLQKLNLLIKSATSKSACNSAVLRTKWRQHLESNAIFDVLPISPECDSQAGLSV